MILFLKPVFFHRVWGGEKLRTEFNYDTMESCGEAWGISAHQNGSSIIENGMYKGKTLRELFNEQRELFGNYSADEFPIIVKFIHAKEDLSVHTHPDNDYAKKHHNSLGKDKCWYVLDAQPGAKVIIGHFAADKKELIQHIETNKLKHILNRFKIRKGDFFYLEAGTLQGICKGSLLLEVAQSSDITYRVFDYNRTFDGEKRQLHITDALNVIKAPDSSVIEFPKNTFFNFDIQKINKEEKFKASTHGDYLCILDGDGFINEHPIKKGDFIMVSSDDRYIIKGDVRVQKTTF